MRLPFRKKEKKYWEGWLPKDLAERLGTIRERVTHLHETNQERHPPLKWFTPHGVAHCKAVEDLLHRLIPGRLHKQLTEDEKFFLLASAWLHDLGMLRGILQDEDVNSRSSDEQIREEHHSRTERYLARFYADVGVTESEKEVFGCLAYFHRRRTDLSHCSELLEASGRPVRLRLLAAYLRLADSLHVDQTRAPASQYAISLAYDIPSRSKLHWLRSKFVLGISADVKKRELVVHLKTPVQKDNPDEKRKMPLDRMLDSIHDEVVDDLAAELNTVKDVLFASGITYFLQVRKEKHTVEFDEELWRDVEAVFNEYFLLDNPSSSALSNLVLQSLGAMVRLDAGRTSKDKGGNQATRRDVNVFLDEVEGVVLRTRRCHMGLRTLISELRKAIEPLSEEDLPKQLERMQSRWNERRKALRFSACRFFDHWCRANQRLRARANKRDRAESDAEPTRFFDVLLYGYSELVIKALCGFRDAIALDLLRDYIAHGASTIALDRDVLRWNDPDALKQALSELLERKRPKKNRATSPEPWPWDDSERLLPIHFADFERQASQQFRIFVCEGQPKNRTDWGGSIVYHDGTQYALSLVEHGFPRVHVVPDAIAPVLFMPFDQSAERPRIDFVMVGANGFGNKEFLHSAGHTMVVGAAKLAKLSNRRPDGGPTVVLALTTDKYSAELGTASGCTHSPRDTVEPTIVVKDGWPFRNSFVGEPVRNQVFISQDPRLRSRLNRPGFPIVFYNCREDRVPIEWVDVVVTERAWLARELEKQWGGEERWSGETIASKDQDSKPGGHRDASPEQDAPQAKAHGRPRGNT